MRVTLTYNGITNKGVFLVNGEQYGASQSGSTKTNEIFEETYLSTYSFGKK